MAKLITKKSAPIASVDSKVEEYSFLRSQAKTIKSRMDALAKEIKSYAEKCGVKDDKGSFYCENDRFIFGNQARKSVSLKQEETLSFLKENGYTEAIKVVETVDESVFERLMSEGKISFEDVESLTNVKVTYAIDIKEKEEMPEAESFDVAAKRRK